MARKAEAIVFAVTVLVAVAVYLHWGRDDDPPTMTLQGAEVTLDCSVTPSLPPGATVEVRNVSDRRSGYRMRVDLIEPDGTIVTSVRFLVPVLAPGAVWKGSRPFAKLGSNRAECVIGSIERS